METQQPSAIMMVRPANFGFNPETAASNAFQKSDSQDRKIITKAALQEFDNVVAVLKESGIDVIVFDDNPEPVKTDAVFPNNWISLHPDGKVIIYPMMSANRRLEKRKEVIDLLSSLGYDVRIMINYSKSEDDGQFLEGTGSIVFDYIHKVAYANRSARTHEGLFYQVCEELAYEAYLFDAVDRNGRAIYHTNVMMCIGEGYAILCAECIPMPQRKRLYEKLESDGIEIIKINFDQMESFAGNMFELKNKSGNRFLAMSQSAFNSLESDQIKQISKHATILSMNIPTIEKYGGGSVRCMMAGVFLPKVKV